MSLRYSLNECAKMVGCSRATIVRWEEQGLIRKAPVSRKTGHRSYSPVDVEYLQRFKAERAKQLHPLLTDPEREVIEDLDE